MKIEIYLDSLFFMNLMINWGVLKILQNKFSLENINVRIFAAAALGASAYVLLFLVPVRSVWWQFVAMGASVPLMVFIVLPRRKRRYTAKMIAWGFAYSFIIAGVLRAVLHKWKNFSGKGITVFEILAGVYIFKWLGIRCIRQGQIAGKRSLCKVTIESAGVQTAVTALIDTGNSLVEPVSKQPVCLIEEELLARITLENPLFLRAIPFRSVGCEKGMLYGVQIPKLVIAWEEDTFVVTDAICAGVGHRLSTKHAYQMILHPDMVTKDNRVIEKESNDCEKQIGGKKCC